MPTWLLLVLVWAALLGGFCVRWGRSWKGRDHAQEHLARTRH